MFVIGEARIEERIAHQRFACDLIQCKGACCTLPGGRGAPLEDAEIHELEAAFPIVQKYLPERHRKQIALTGMYEGHPGNFATSCVDNRDCVFVFYDEGIARCALEKAFLNGEIQWRKPLSCHLFPIRISKGQVEEVRFEKISECTPAIADGKAKDIPLYEFLKEPLTRKFGKEWYDQFHLACTTRDASSFTQE